MASPAAGIVEWDVPDLLLPRFSVRHDVGDGVGYENGFTYLQGWIPVLQKTDRSVLFTDFRVVNFDNADYWEFNAGGGARWYHPGRDRIFGVNAYYDGRKTANSFLNQVGFGVESLGKYVDFRANTYTVLGSASQVIAETGSSTSSSSSSPVFQGFNIVVGGDGRTRIVDNALSGFDTEVGTPIPLLERWDARAFVGYYHYAGGQGPDVNGVRGRLEAQVNHNMSLHFAAQNDAVLGTTISGGIAMHLGGRRVGREHRAVVDRLDARVVRDVNIIINRTTEETKGTKEVMMDATTGQPIVVRHANSNAAPGGDGSVEKPFQTLAELQTNAQPNAILFVHANSTFTTPKVVLLNGQRLLGEGIDHKFTSTKGTFLLPRATTGTISPLFSINTTDVAIFLDRDNEVAGITATAVKNVDTIFILANNKDLGTFTINRNSIDVNTAGIGLSGSSGNGVIQNNTFTSSTSASSNSQAANFFFQSSVASASSRLLIENNQFSGISKGIRILQSGASSTLDLSIRNNGFTNTTSMDNVVSAGTQTLQLLNNAGTGAFNLTQSSPGTFRLEASLGTTSPLPTTVSGTINPVPDGSAGFP